MNAPSPVPGAATPISHSPFATYEPSVPTYEMGTGFAYPLEYTGWKDEVLAWKETCYLHAGLNPTHTCRVTGPDTTKMFNAICVNNIERLKVGRSTHAIMCSPQGNVTAHGMLVRLAEDDYMTYWLEPVTSYHATSGQFDVTSEILTGKKFLLQLGGPRSLEVLEAALDEDLHDLQFLGHRPATIGGANIGISGCPLTVLRVGMAGTLAYEVHGDIEDAVTVYDALMVAGEPFGMRRLGALSYLPLNHTENGFPQLTAHFPFALPEDPGLMAFLRATGWPVGDEPGKHELPGFVLRGSMEGDWSARYVNPVELGWGHLIKLDHEFVGRDALEPIKANPTHQMVTLVWDPEDVLDTYRSHFESGAEYQLMEFPTDPRFTSSGRPIFNDKVLKDGRLVGMSMGRIYTYSYRGMISICPIEVELAEPGTEVTVVWGDPGTRQKEIRATVARYPLLDLPRNEHIDVGSIPRRA